MSEPFLGEIAAFAFNFPPKGWAFCAGQLMPINQNQALFALIGTYFGGDGVRTFALPDLRGRIAVSSGQGPGLSNYDLGQVGGVEAHTLTVSETPVHTHPVNAVNNGQTNGTNVPSPTLTLGSGYATSGVVNIYSTTAASIAMTPLQPTGGQAHENRMPGLVLTYCI